MHSSLRLLPESRRRGSGTRRVKHLGVRAPTRKHGQHMPAKHRSQPPQKHALAQRGSVESFFRRVCPEVTQPGAGGEEPAIFPGSPTHTCQRGMVASGRVRTGVAARRALGGARRVRQVGSLCHNVLARRPYSYHSSMHRITQMATKGAIDPRHPRVLRAPECESAAREAGGARQSACPELPRAWCSRGRNPRTRCVPNAAPRASVPRSLLTRRPAEERFPATPQPLPLTKSQPGPPRAGVRRR